MEKRVIIRMAAYGLLTVLFLSYFLAVVTESVQWSLFLVSFSPAIICFFVITVLKYDKSSRRGFKNGSWYDQ